MPETTFEKIIRKTGMKPVECKCQKCKSQCQAPCKGTPEDMVKLIAAGYKDRIAVYVLPKFTDKLPPEFWGVQYVAGQIDPTTKYCTFFKNGLCELHDLGLKPTEGKLSHHSTEKFNWSKSLTKYVLEEWQKITEEDFQKILNKHL